MKVYAYHRAQQTVLLAGEGGLKASELISRHMIDHFVPFLPLERRHVIMCVRSYLEGAKYDVSNDRIEQLADSLQVCVGSSSD